MKRKIWLIIAAAAVLTVSLLILWAVWGNTALELNTYTVSSDRLPGAFDGYRIAHVSDLHNTEMGKDNRKLLAMLRQAKPDMIAITGDLIDGRRTDVDVAVDFAREAMKIAPCYYVTGNHEQRAEDYYILRRELIALGVVVLEDERVQLQREGESITVIGVNDPTFRSEIYTGTSEQVMDSKLEYLEDPKNYTILLSHRPELFDIYARHDIDLALSGHAHGGQIRLPFAGGVLVPDQGFFPKYDDGLHTKGNTNMIISRGIGNSVFPLRINNRPEVVLIELNRESR